MRNKEISAALEETYKSIRKYLVLSGWEEPDFNRQPMECIGYVIDPINGMLHRIDLAYIIQSERNYLELLKKDKEYWNEDFENPSEIKGNFDSDGYNG